jgi:hypothetical protein
MQTQPFRACLNQVYFSATCRGFYLVLILASVTVCAWTLAHFGTFPDELWFVALEATLSGAVIAEVCLRLYLQGCQTFIINWSNLFDIGVIVCSVIAVAVALISNGLVGEVEGLSGQALLVFYCSVQYLRLALFLKSRYQQTHVPEVVLMPEVSARSDIYHKHPPVDSFSSDA